MSGARSRHRRTRSARSSASCRASSKANTAPRVIIVTGVMAAGKSTVAQLLAESFDRSVHLRGDAFRTMIVKGRVEPAPDDEAALEQLRLRYRVATAAADAYAEAGFTVVLQDVIVGPLLVECISLVRTRPLHLVVLTPSLGSVEERENQRSKVGYGNWTLQALDAVLREQTPRVGLWIDSSAQTPRETVDVVLAHLDEAIVPDR